MCLPWQGEAGKAQRTKHDQQHRDNLIRIKGDKQREIDRLGGELEECQAALAVSQAKEQAVTSRKKMLEKEACLTFPTFATYSWSSVRLHASDSCHDYDSLSLRNPLSGAFCAFHKRLSLPACLLPYRFV